MAGRQPFHVAVADPLQRTYEGFDVAAVMSVDRADASVTINVVTAEQHIADSKRELAVGVSGSVPDFDLDRSDFDDVAIVDLVFDLDRRHRHLQILGFDLGERDQCVTGLQWFDGVGVRRDGGFEKLFRLWPILECGRHRRESPPTSCIAKAENPVGE